MIKAIFFDIDGTLVSTKTRACCPSARQALWLLRKKGIKLFIATGRSKFEINGEKLLDGLKFDGILTNNGQDGYDGHGNLLYGNPIHPQDVQAIVNWADRQKAACWLVSARDSVLNRMNSRVDEAMDLIHTRPPRLGSLHETAQDPVFKVVLFLNRQEMNHIMPLAPHSRSTQWFENGFDIIAGNGGKGVAVKSLWEHYGFTRQQTMAFGDGHNDIEMLRAVGIGVAMGNAGDEVKAAADYVTDDVDENGLYNALTHFGLI